MRKTIFGAVLLSVILSGCVSIYFDRYPGQALDEIPGKFRGTYLAQPHTLIDNYFILYEMDSTGKMLPESRIEVFAKGWREYKGEDKSWGLSDSIVFSKYKKYYFVSHKTLDGWETALIDRSRGTWRLTPIGYNLHDSTTVQKVNKLFLTNNLSSHVPMDEEVLIDYYKTELKGRNYYLLIKQ